MRSVFNHAVRWEFTDHNPILETAQVLGLPHGTEKAQLARARAKLARTCSERSNTIPYASAPREISDER